LSARSHPCVTSAYYTDLVPRWASHFFTRGTSALICCGHDHGGLEYQRSEDDHGSLDVFSPTLAAVASGPLASASWVIAHLLLVAAFALLPCRMLAIYAALADGPTEPHALRGLVLGMAGTGLVGPAVGVEVFAMPVIGRLYLDGVTGVAPALASIYRGPMTLVMIVGLIMLAVGAIDLARAVWRSGILWLPLLPRPVRILDGLMFGLGGVWLAWGIWRRGKRAAENTEA
jgi:hypothetical protein